ncbi:MAG: SAM-dependent methyltransferase [Anaerolinea sp.]|nr:SAM-dependent methyltransferase [Anaerolinea sp.]
MPVPARCAPPRVPSAEYGVCCAVMAKFRGHRGFAALWDWMTRHESRSEREMRKLAGSRVSGRVLELGVGVGANWDYLPEGVQYTGIEPDPYMVRRARERMAARGRDMALHQSRAEELPFADETFDTVLVTLALCTVQDPGKALAEVRRVLAPGGTLVFAEHVRPAGRVWGRLADGVTPAWSRVAAGCHPNRQTEAAITRAGLAIETISKRRVGGLPMIAGIARKPGPADAP